MLLVAGRKKKGREREREKSSERLEGGGGISSGRTGTTIDVVLAGPHSLLHIVALQPNSIPGSHALCRVSQRAGPTKGGLCTPALQQLLVFTV